ncbi:GntR family transcriptional regulator [Phaeobacter sp. QD34_3]|uniref:GntR family transcriptional regulator n=1 Tax=unclassified Phaeobacter TaxID=2621772 RepID=UPI00237FA85D|nr:MULTISPECIES: GntR family transcriptional regulator [unclassified Phaeobacter]MDE4134326.1 GntR family transcriptional regulator [Phaeobacter sp. QD34_3]MDE4137659.1 GntR family transcriptional regulator [Phaeobacter sp. QD34_24]
MTTAQGSARDRFELMHREIRDRICLLDYAPGTRLSEIELAEEFGVSRTPLRRVLARLEDEGLVQSVHGVGTFVTDVNLDALAQTYQLRMELAGMMGHVMPLPPDDTLLTEFRALSARSKSLLQTPAARDFAQLITDFFRATLKLTSNMQLRLISERLYYQTARIWLTSVSESVIDLEEEMRIFDGELDTLIGALETRDLRAAALLQQAHISMSYARMSAAG